MWREGYYVGPNEIRLDAVGSPGRHHDPSSEQSRHLKRDEARFDARAQDRWPPNPLPDPDKGGLVRKGLLPDNAALLAIVSGAVLSEAPS